MSVRVVIAVMLMACGRQSVAAKVTSRMFTRADCEAQILGPGGQELRDDVRRYLLRLHGTPLVPINFVEPRVQFDRLDPDFAEWRLRKEAGDELPPTADEIREARAEADAYSKLHQAELDAPLGDPGPFTPKQAEALGIHQPFDGPVTELTTFAYVQDAGRTLSLCTMEGVREIGDISLSLDTLEIGINHDILFWAYKKMQNSRSKRMSWDQGEFMLTHGVVALRPTDPVRPFMYVVHLQDLIRPLSDHQFQFDVYRVKECLPAVARDAPLFVPPLVLENGRSRRFEPTDLKLNMFEDGGKF